MTIKKEGKNYKLGTGKKEYMLVVNKGKLDNEYDIIDFSTGELQEVIIFNDKVISR
jgi:competence protein ComEC